MEVIAKEQKTVKQKMSDVLLDISLAKSWLYLKLDGIDGNGKQTDFTEAEKEQLREALRDLSGRISKCADML